MTPDLQLLIAEARAAHRAGDVAALRRCADAFVDALLASDAPCTVAEMVTVGGLDHYAGSYPHVRLNLKSQCVVCTPGRRREVGRGTRFCR